MQLPQQTLIEIIFYCIISVNIFEKRQYGSSDLKWI